MDAATRQLFRYEILRQLADATPLALRSNAVAIVATSRGFSATSQAVEAELAYLKDKGLVTTTDHPISPELLDYRITAAGRDEAARLGLA